MHKLVGPPSPARACAPWCCVSIWRLIMAFEFLLFLVPLVLVSHRPPPGAQTFGTSKTNI